MTKHFVIFIFICFVSAPIVSADFESEKMNNWHHWRGPLYNGAAQNANPPTTWNEDKNIKWKVEIPGNGSSTPIIWGKKVFVTTAIETAKAKEGAQADGRAPSKYYKFDVICFDRDSGKVIWQKTAAETVPHEGTHGTNTYASGSPTTDGEFLYVTFGSQGIFCYDLDGNQIWKRDLGDMQTRNSFGEGTSLTVHGDNLIVTWDHEGPSFIANLSAKTGDTKWKIDRDEQTTWATPLVVEHNGVTQVIANGAKRAISYDVKDGSIIWQCGGQTGNPIPTPFARNGIAYVSSGWRGAALYAIPLDSKGDITGTDKIAWSHNNDTPYVPSPVLIQDRIYFTKDRNPIMSCVNADTGKVILPAARLPELLGNMYASPAASGDKVFFTTRDGTTLVLKIGEETKPLSVNKLDDEIDASPVMVGDSLFLRGKDYLYCIEAS
ncbi:MAG: PQQ-binding-like beta-propeller repeat protein [Candidatus Hinthialibacter antarcticus]|nr:PQQ-binding-like beta-propeller repeat protein [Candidatus Hinthialibacter antarcticus]